MIQTLFYLFNTESRLNMSPPSQNVWSKINFSSFGTPEYSSEENIKEAARRGNMKAMEYLNIDLSMKLNTRMIFQLYFNRKL